MPAMQQCWLLVIKFSTMEENLNLDYNIKLLVLKALNKFKKIGPAAEALGVSERTLKRYKRGYRIKRGGKRYYENVRKLPIIEPKPKVYATSQYQS